MTRYQIIRAGLINLFEYSNQTFEFAGGHLLLRGHNGAGKSKALELLLPFVLDGDTRPEKLDPFATRARPMKWNLLMDGRHDVRQGYVWLEFHHPEFNDWVTLAVGLRATREHKSTDTWFAIIRDARVGIDIELVNRQTNTPHPKRGLRDKLGANAYVFENATDYRARVNEILFGFGTVERYETMLSLQRQLRRPHLSRDLEPQQLSDILSESLPEIDFELVGDLGRKLDTIEQLRTELAALRNVHRQFGAFVDTYRAYSRAVTLARLSDVTDQHGRLTAARRRLNEHLADQRAAAEELHTLNELIDELTSEQHELHGQEQELLVSPEMLAAERLASLKDLADAAERAHNQISGRLSDLRRDVDDARGEQRDAVAAHRAALDETHTAVRELAEHARLARLAQHDQLVDHLTEGGDPAATEHAMRQHARERRGRIAEQRNLRAAAQRAEQVAADRRDAADSAEQTLRTLADQQRGFEDELAAGRDALFDQVAAWTDALRELPVSEELSEQLLDHVSELTDEHRPLSALLTAAYRAADQALADTHADARHARDQLTGRRDELNAERQRWLDEHDPEPDAPATRTADRTGRDGAPLWRLIDFTATPTDAQRAGLEGALQASGLLDAWITPEGQLLDVDGDTFALPIGGDGMLRESLTAVDHGPVPAAVTARVLDAIPCRAANASASEDLVCVGLDGTFRVGPAAGSHAKPAAQFIGAAAREQDRQRRIAELTRLIDELAVEITYADEQLAALAGRRRQLDAELTDVPSEEHVRAAHRALRDITRRCADARKTATDALAAAETAETAAATARGTSRQHAHDHQLPAPGHTPTLDELDDAVAEYVASVPALIAAHRAAARELARHEKATENLARLNDRETELASGVSDAHGRLAGARGAYTAASERDGATAQQTIARRDELRHRLQELGEQLTEFNEDRDKANRKEASLASTLAMAESSVSDAERARADALARFKALAPHDLLTLALGDAAPPPGELDGWAANDVLALSRAHRDRLKTPADVDRLTDRVDNGFMALRMELDPSVGLEPIKDRDGDLILVSVRRDGGQEPVRVGAQRIREEIDAHQRLLSEEEERTFEEFLFNGLAGHLRERILNAHQLVTQINAAIADCRTSSGIAVDLHWRPEQDGDPLLTRALQLLRTAPEALTDRQRIELVRFFRDRVEAGRVTTADGTVTQHLVEALDYRRWHRFTVMQDRDGRRVPLTKASHQAGSGGEKSAALHLPLFAAAAALMESAAPFAPRMIMLDEAFAGIDTTMRRHLLGLICLFDLDFLITSHELWCCEPELDRLSIYHLHRQPGLAGVGAVQFLWDGHSKTEIAAAA